MAQHAGRITSAASDRTRASRHFLEMTVSGTEVSVVEAFMAIFNASYNLRAGTKAASNGEPRGSTIRLSDKKFRTWMQTMQPPVGLTLVSMPNPQLRPNRTPTDTYRQHLS